MDNWYRQNVTEQEKRLTLFTCGEVFVADNSMLTIDVEEDKKQYNVLFLAVLHKKATKRKQTYYFPLSFVFLAC